MIAVQIVSKNTGIVAAQLCGILGNEENLERELAEKLLPDCQRIRTVQSDHPSVREFQTRVDEIQADMDARIVNDPELKYTRNPARYAKGKVALQIPGIDGWKSVAALVLTGVDGIAPNARYSGREKSYIVSPRQADRFEAAIEALRVKRQEYLCPVPPTFPVDTVSPLV